MLLAAPADTANPAAEQAEQAACIPPVPCRGRNSPAVSFGLGNGPAEFARCARLKRVFVGGHQGAVSNSIIPPVKPEGFTGASRCLLYYCWVTVHEFGSS